MLYYIIRRCFAAVAMLFLISIITFGMFYAGPTDPARLTCGKNCTAQSIAANRHFLGLDKPVTTQYAEFVGGLFHERNYPDDAVFITTTLTRSLTAPPRAWVTRRCRHSS